PLRKGRPIDFRYGTDKHDLPFRARIREPRDKSDIDTLIDDAIKPQTRLWNFPVCGMNVGAVQGLGEMGDINAAGKTMNVGMALALGAKETGTAGEDNVRFPE